MKKFFYMLGLSMFLAGCSESFDDWMNPQSNDPEAAKTIAVNVQPVPAIDFEAIEGDSVQLFDLSVELPDEASTRCVAYLYNAERTDSIAVEADAQGRAAVADLRTAVERLYGKRPVQREVPVLVNAYVNVNGQSMKYQGETSLLVTLVAPEIENSYYLIGTHQSWNSATVTNYKFSRADESVDVYDDPVFTITVDAPVNDEGERVDFWFNIVPESVLGKEGNDFWHHLLGSDIANGDDRLEAGIAEKVNGADNAFMQPASDGAVAYTITINMMDGVMAITPISYSEFIFVPGNPGWNPATAAALRSPALDGVYTGYVYLDGDFKFTKERNWNGEYNYTHFSSYSEGFSQGEGTNIHQSSTGFYYLTVDVPNATLKATLTKWGIIGPGQPGGWDDDTDMTYDATEGCWKATLALAADEIKFRANDSWDINVGGSFDDLVANGGNIRVEEAGTYEVKLFLQRTDSEKMYATLTKK